MARCRARTDRGTLCKNPVKEAGQRCRHHKGKPEAGPKPYKARSPRRRTYTPQPPRRQASPIRRPSSSNATQSVRRAQEQRQRRVRESAESCNRVISGAWQDVVTHRASQYVSEDTWLQMVSRRRHRKCILLAEVASAILNGRDAIHGFVGSVAGEVVFILGAGRVVKTFAQELASRLPLPMDTELVAVARALQVTGVLLCSLNSDDLTRCQCFIDLALVETKENVGNLLTAAMNDWVNLGSYA